MRFLRIEDIHVVVSNLWLCLDVDEVRLCIDQHEPWIKNTRMEFDPVDFDISRARCQVNIVGLTA